jgi:hypothetical protein
MAGESEVISALSFLHVTTKQLSPSPFEEAASRCHFDKQAADFPD